MRKKDYLWNVYQRIKNNYKNKIVLNIFDKDTKKVLSKNKELENRFSGKRCFIIGNGPSVKQQDISVLKDEFVFTVNYSANSKQFNEVKTTAHIWTDPNIFKSSEESGEKDYLLNSIKAVKTPDNNPINFFPIEQKAFLEENGIDKILDINYIAPCLDWMYEGYDEKIDLTKYLPVFGTVVQFCIIIAVYLGFKEIYLLGCDNTGIVNCVNALLDEIDEENYSYQVTEIEKSRMKSGAQRNGLETETSSYLQCIKGFRILNEYCIKRGIKLYNCSAKTVIDSIERIRFEDVIQ